MTALILGASALLVSAASGCAPGYQPYATTTVATPVVQAQVAPPVIQAEATVAAPAPVIDAQVQIAPAPQPIVVQPELVTLTPDVQVVAAYDEPVFYTGGYYWREVDGGWYRSHTYDRGWTSYEAPYAVRSIENRHAYRNYRPAGWRSSYDRPANTYQPRPSYTNRGYDRPAYQRPAQNYQPRPSGGWDRNPGYQRPAYDNAQPRPAYGNNQPRPAYGNNQPRPAYGNSQPRPAYSNSSQNYQPRPSYQQPRQNYQPRPSYQQPRQNYQPRPSYQQPKQSYQPRPAYGNGGSSNGNYKRSSSSDRRGSRRR